MRHTRHASRTRHLACPVSRSLRRQPQVNCCIACPPDTACWRASPQHITRPQTPPTLCQPQVNYLFTRQLLLTTSGGAFANATDPASCPGRVVTNDEVAAPYVVELKIPCSCEACVRCLKLWPTSSLPARTHAAWTAVAPAWDQYAHYPAPRSNARERSAQRDRRAGGAAHDVSDRLQVGVHAVQRAAATLQRVRRRAPLLSALRKGSAAVLSSF